MKRRMLPVLAFAGLACVGSERPTPAPPPNQPTPAAAPPAAPAGPPEVMLRGTVRMEPSPMFRSCDLAVSAAFLDSTRSRILPTYQFLGASEEQGLYLVARGAVSPRGEAILREVEFAGVPSETDGCEQVPPSYVLLARGINPSWRVTVTESSIEFVQSDEPSRIDFPPGSPIDSAQAVVYRSTAVGAETHNLQLTLRRTGCHEGNHIYAAMRAELRIDGRVLTGCAWRGRVP